jgi:DNA-binding IclR family transcriptional regulator
LRVQWHRALEEAVEEIGESCNLTILEGDKVLYLDRVETRRPLRLHLEPGTRVPLHCTASGKLFLCQMGREQVRRLLGAEPLESHTDKTITRYADLFEDLARVLGTQVGTHDCELFDDSVAIAVPIADAAGYIYAAVAVHAPSSRESIESCMRYLPALRKAAARIAATMTPPPAEPPGRSAPAVARGSSATKHGSGVPVRPAGSAKRGAAARASSRRPLR